MKKGELIGKGMTAEVYEWGKDKILKLFFDRFDEDWINYEVKIGTTVNEAGVPSPAIFEMIELDSRKGIIYQRISGKTMLIRIQEEPWKLYYYAQQLAGLQYKIHQYSVVNLPSQKERFRVRINSSSIILGEQENKILDYIDSLPNGNSVCHGDFHFNNIIVSENRLVPIDWTNAYQGNPLGDVARTCLMMNSPYKSPLNLDILIPSIQYTKLSTYWTYLNEYMRLSKAKFEDIDKWLLPVAAARLRDKIPGEEKWLMDIINKRLKNLEVGD